MERKIIELARGDMYAMVICEESPASPKTFVNSRSETFFAANTNLKSHIQQISAKKKCLIHIPPPPPIYLNF